VNVLFLTPSHVEGKCLGAEERIHTPSRVPPPLGCHQLLL
jgi:hypothetical protein